MSYWRWRFLPKLEVQPFWSVKRGGEMRWPLECVCALCDHNHSWWSRKNWFHNQSNCPKCGQRGAFF